MVLLAVALLGCGRTELGSDLLLGPGGASAGGTTSDALGGPASGVGGATVSTDSTTSFDAIGSSASADGTDGAGGSGSVNASSASTVSGGVGGSTVSASTASASSASTASGGVGGSTASGASTTSGGVGGGVAGAGGDCLEDSCSHSWGVPVPLETDDSREAWGAQVAMNDDGIAVVGYTQNSAEDTQIWAIPYAPSGGWGDTDLIFSETSYTNLPRVAIDDAGLAMLAWDAHAKAPVRGSANDPLGSGGEWGPAEFVSVTENSRGFEPALAMDANGTAVVVWTEQVDASNSGANELWANAWTPDEGWGSATPIQQQGGTTMPALAMNAAGDTVAVWSQGNGETSWLRNIWSSRAEAGIGWTTPELIHGIAAEPGYDPKVANDPQGNALVVWWQFTAESRAQIWANRFTAGVGWGDAEVIDAVPVDASAVDAYSAGVGVDRNGNATAVWRQVEGAVAEIWVNRYTPASGWGTPERISGGAFDCNQPALAVGSAGDAVVVWAQTTSEGTTLWSNRYAPGSGWSEPELLDASSQGPSVDPDVAIDGKGDAIAVWVRGGGGWSVWASSSSRPP